MDSGVSLSESCKTCMPSNQKPKTDISGQGDSAGTKVASSEREANSKNKNGKDKRKSNVNVNERERKLPEMQCHCLTNKMTESKQRKESELKNDTILNNFEYKNSVNYEDENKIIKNKTSSHMDMSSCEKLLTASLIELSEKVEFLLQMHKNYGFMEKYTEQSHSTQSFFGNSWPLYNLNKRMCQAEEEIQKLTLILEKLLKTSNGKKENLSVVDDFTQRNPLQKATTELKTNFVKKRTNWPTSSTVDYLESNSIEKICSRLGLLRNEEESKEIYSVSLFEHRSEEINQNEIVKTLQKLRDDTSNSKDKISATHKVVSNEAQYLLGRKLENKQELPDVKEGVRQLKGRLEQVKEETEDNLELHETTSRLLAQEALLKSYLDKIQNQLYSKLDPTAKGFLKSNPSLLKNVIHGTKEEENVGSVGSDVLSCSDDTCVFREAESEEKRPSIESSEKETKFSSKEHEKIEKEEQSRTVKTPDHSNSVDNIKSSKPPMEQPTRRRKTASTVSQKPGQHLQSIPEFVSPFPGKVRTSTLKTEPRPVTAPNTDKKFSSSSEISTSKNYVRPSTQESGVKATSGNNVKNKNKSLVYKKALVGES